MDESGFSIGKIEASRVIINSKIRQKYQAQPGRQEWVSVIECISADGTAISPLVILKARTCQPLGFLQTYMTSGGSHVMQRVGQVICMGLNGSVVVLILQHEKKRMAKRVFSSATGMKVIPPPISSPIVFTITLC